MLQEDEYVRFIGTGELGVVIESHGDGTYDVGLSNQGPAQRDQCWLTANEDEIEQVVEGPVLSRRDVADDFDLVCFEVERDDGRNGAVMAISKTGIGYEVRVYSFTGCINATVPVVGFCTRALRKAFKDLETHGWVQGFGCDGPVRDGHWWRLDVYAGARFYTCGGENACPDELPAFLNRLAEWGVPQLFDANNVLALK